MGLTLRDWEEHSADLREAYNYDGGETTGEGYESIARSYGVEMGCPEDSDYKISRLGILQLIIWVVVLLTGATLVFTFWAHILVVAFIN